MPDDVLTPRTARRNDPAGVRERLLDAAMRVVREHGAADLTLDAVARAAQVSKGGLLYHFPSKPALIEALLILLIDRFRLRVEAQYDALPAEPGRWLRAYVRASFSDVPPPIEIIVLLSSHLAEHPHLLEHVRADHALWAERCTTDGVPAARARIIRSAADGYWSEGIVGVHNALSTEDRRAHEAELLGLIDC
jgi:AcrR family transcriptional regulator